MDLSVKISLALAGIYLLAGMLIGVVKYRMTMLSVEHKAPVYIDIAHRAAFMYSFAALVIAELLDKNALPNAVLLPATLAVLTFFGLTILGYLFTGLKNKSDNIVSEKNLSTTWFMYLLIASEITGLIVILAGFLTYAARY